MPHFNELEQEIEQLALRVVLREGEGDATSPQDPAWLPALEGIRQQAVKSGATSVAEIARNISESLARQGPDATRELTEGIAHLQQAMQALEKEQSQQERPERSIAQDPELLSDFVLESREHLANIEAQILTLERDPCHAEALHSVFRSFHTVKGLAGFLELWEIQKVAHEVETILDKARNAQLTITPAAIDVVLESADYLRRWVEHVESVLQNRPSQAPPRDERLLTRVTSLSSTACAQEVSAALLELASTVESPGQQALPPPEPANEGTRRSEAMAVRVDTTKLDYLADMAGELVIAETLVRHDPELAKLKSPRLQRNVSQLTRITAELQKTAMAMRLVPIGPLFQRMARLVRDLSRQFGKKIELQTEGDDIELDRTIAQELADPLMHMVRNSVDHGIELPDQRQALGKPATATLLLKAHHQSGQVVVQISDDGRGLDRVKIRAKAIEKGLLADGEEPSDSEVYNLIFTPGFSTASQVTNVSGRGVGMDVVRRHIEKLRGRIEIRSVAGQGCSFLLKLPLTLAIIDGLVVGVGSERYIVPLFAVREMFRPKEETLWTVQEQAEMALVRGALLPVLRLYRKFGVTPNSEDPGQSVLLVAEVEGQRFCLLVDELLGKQEVVIKSLGAIFKDVAGVSGGAILGDGRVGLILDLDRLFKDKARDANV